MSLDSGLLYQRIMHVPGLTGTWRQRADQYMRALTGRPYDGSLQTGLYLLDQIKNRNFPQAPAQQAAVAPVAPTAPVVDRATTEGKAATEGTPTLDFKKDVMPWEEFFDENLALSSSAQQAGGYYTPLLQRGREGVESDFASRGLTRSGMRGRSVMDLYKDFAEKEQKMRDQLYGIREGEAKENYGFQQSMYEEDPRGYKPTSYKTEKYEYDYPVESPGRYGQSYRDWLRSTYKI